MYTCWMEDHLSDIIIHHPHQKKKKLKKPQESDMASYKDKSKKQWNEFRDDNYNWSWDISLSSGTERLSLPKSRAVSTVEARPTISGWSTRVQKLSNFKAKIRKESEIEIVRICALKLLEKGKRGGPGNCRWSKRLQVKEWRVTVIHEEELGHGIRFYLPLCKDCCNASCRSTSVPRDTAAWDAWGCWHWWHTLTSLSLVSTKLSSTKKAKNGLLPNTDPSIK